MSAGITLSAAPLESEQRRDDDGQYEGHEHQRHQPSTRPRIHAVETRRTRWSIVARVPADESTGHRRVAPLDVDAVRTMQVGTVLWAVALAATFVARDSLDADGRAWWIWTCVAGVGLGLLGLLVTTRRRRHLAQRS